MRNNFPEGFSAWANDVMQWVDMYLYVDQQELNQRVEEPA